MLNGEDLLQLGREVLAGMVAVLFDESGSANRVAGGNGPVVAGGQGQMAALEGPSGPDLRLEHARKLAKENPLAMASVVRGWMNN